jgi:hypothetical protein
MGGMKSILAFILAWGVHLTAIAQSPVERAIVLGSEDRWDEALAVLSPAVAGAYQSDPHAWYILGFVQKERFKRSPSLSANNAERLASIQAFQRCRQLAPMGPDAAMSGVALEYLAESFYQDAHAAIVQFTAGDDPSVLALLSRYESTWLNVHPDAEFVDQEFDLFHRLAEANSALLDPSFGLNEGARAQAFEAAVAHYLEAQALQPQDERTQFNLAVTWYNEGVRKIRAINAQVSLAQLMNIQSECVAHFKEALAPMESAYALNPKKASTLNGLMIIHRALGQTEDSTRFKLELEALKGNP